MARASIHPALQAIRGQLGGHVFREVRGKLVVSVAPDWSQRKPTGHDFIFL